ncbi:uncharacterized protein LOC111372759 [Olea europaea var. sylvestris]|uniref:uncharacterized protein LOC111372759 n=1 Tax=Olea europaea var. sylvestris TaxID=158386 RepID=UPI000C1D256A|nr:uncharacterized protein LOC111372759 [Olea europaea var. sylvestris]
MTRIWGMITTIASRVVPLAIGSSFCSHHLIRSVSRAGLSRKLFHRLFPSSLHYYSTRSTIQELFMRGMESQEEEEKLKKFELSNFRLSRKDEAETIHVEILKVGAVSAESGNYKNKANLSVVFGLMKKGLFLSLYCTVYTDKISLDSLRVEENRVGHYVGIPYS